MGKDTVLISYFMILMQKLCESLFFTKIFFKKYSVHKIPRAGKDSAIMKLFDMKKLYTWTITQLKHDIWKKTVNKLLHLRNLT